MFPIAAEYKKDNEKHNCLIMAIGAVSNSSQHSGTTKSAWSGMLATIMFEDGELLAVSVNSLRILKPESQIIGFAGIIDKKD